MFLTASLMFTSKTVWMCCYSQSSEKHASLIQLGVDYRIKSFIIFASEIFRFVAKANRVIRGYYHKTFYNCNFYFCNKRHVDTIIYGSLQKLFCNQHKHYNYFEYHKWNGYRLKLQRYFKMLSQTAWFARLVGLWKVKKGV